MKSDFQDTSMSYDLEFCPPSDFKEPVLLSERRLVRIQLMRYLRSHGASDVSHMSWEQFSALLASYVEVRPPSKTAVESFVNGSASTSVRIVRIFKQFLIDTKFCRESDFCIVDNVEPLVEALRTISGSHEQDGQQDQFIIRIYFNLSDMVDWKFVRRNTNVMLIKEFGVASEKICDPLHETRRIGYAFRTQTGDIIGAMKDQSRSLFFVFDLHPEANSINEEKRNSYTGSVWLVLDNIRMKFQYNSIAAHEIDSLIGSVP